MRILITGSSGQIGSNLGLALQALGHEVFGIDNRKNTWTNKIETIIQDVGNQGVKIGRPFPPLTDWCRVSTGTMEEMEALRRALQAVFG